MKKKPSEIFWRGLEDVGHLQSTRAGWRALCGALGAALIEKHLIGTGQPSSWYPDPDCPRRLLEVTEHSIGDGYLAFSTDEDHPRPDLDLSKADVAVYVLPVGAVAALIAKPLGFASPARTKEIAPCAIALGKMPSHGLSVYLVVPSSESDFSLAFTKIRQRDASPLAIITPTSRFLPAEFRHLEDSGDVQHAALCDLLSLSPSGFSSVTSLSDYLSPGKEPSSRSSDDSRAILERMDQRFDKVDEGLANVGKHVMGLESENKMLKEKFANRMVALAQKVDTEFLNWIWAILANGSVNSAAKALKIPGSTFDAKVKAYAQRGGIYKTLYSITAIRRHGIGQKCIERYNEIFDEHQAKDVCSDPSAWKDVLDGLEAMNAKNWPKARQELLEIVQELVSET